MLIHYQKVNGIFIIRGNFIKINYNKEILRNLEDRVRFRKVMILGEKVSYLEVDNDVIMISNV